MISKNIAFFIETISGYVIKYTLGLFIWRDKKYITFYCRIPKNKELFLHNTKYLFLYLNNISNKYGYKLNWLCNDKGMRKHLRTKGYKNIRSTKSLSGIYYALKSKFWFHNFAPNYLRHTALNRGAVIINLWHGAGAFKKCNYKPVNLNNKFAKMFYEICRIKDTYNIMAGGADVESFKIAFDTKDEQIKRLGYPRLDVLFNDFKDEDVFAEDDYELIRNLKNQGKKLILYVPTHRDNGKSVTDWLKNKELSRMLKENNAVLLCKLHFIDSNAIDFELSEEILNINNQADIQPLLRFADIMITDYSSVFFDYLLLDRPIIYFPFDYDEYIKECHDFYAPYDTKIAGKKVFTESELIETIKETLQNGDNYSSRRKELLDVTFDYHDGNNCERIVEWLRSL